MTPVPLLPTPGLLRKQLLKATSTDTQCHFQAGGVTLYNSPCVFTQAVIRRLAGMCNSLELGARENLFGD